MTGPSSVPVASFSASATSSVAPLAMNVIDATDHNNRPRPMKVRVTTSAKPVGAPQGVGRKIVSGSSIDLRAWMMTCVAALAVTTSSQSAGQALPAPTNLRVTSTQTVARNECASPPPGTIFCEDFEGANPKANFDDYDGNPDTENQIVANAGPSGNAANKVIRFRVPPAQSGGSDLLKVLPGSYDRLYARWYVQYESGFNFAARNHGGGLSAGARNYVGASGYRPTGADFAGFYLQYDDGTARPYAYSYYRGMYQDCGSPGNCWGDSLPCVYDTGASYCTKPQHRPSGALPTFTAGQWHCVEQMVDMGTPTAIAASANGRLTLWFDGQQIGDFTDLWIRTIAGLKLQHLWLALYHHDGSHSVAGELLDNVVVSTQRIGC